MLVIIKQRFAKSVKSLLLVTRQKAPTVEARAEYFVRGRMSRF
jgi:hypothetical protein